MEDYPHPYVIDTDGDLKLVNPNIDEVFGGMTATLDKIKSCTIRHIDDIYDKKNLNLISDHAYEFDPHKTLGYLDDALQEINDIKALGNKVVNNVKKEVSGTQDGEKWVVIDDDPTVTDEWLKTTTKLFIDDLISKSEVVLIRVRDKLIKRNPGLIEGGNAKSSNRTTALTKRGAIQQKKSEVSSEMLSFKYIHFNEGQSNLTDLKRALITHGLIDSKTTLPDFRKVFAGVKIDTPIKWTGTPTEFAYFIKLLVHIDKKVEVPFQMRWKVAGYCFEQSNGTAFQWEKLRLLKEPANANELKKLATIL